MSQRRPIPERVKVQVAIRQATGGVIWCALCHKPMGPDDPRILEHMVPYEFFSDKEIADSIGNLAWVHQPCAALKTNGNKSTAAGGDIHKIAKSKRLNEDDRLHRAILRGEVERKRSRIASRPFPGGIDKCKK